MNVLDIKEVMKRTRLSRMTIYRLEQRDEFPRRIQLSPNRVGWNQEMIDDWIKNRPSSTEYHAAQRDVLVRPAGANWTIARYTPKRR